MKNFSLLLFLILFLSSPVFADQVPNKTEPSYLSDFFLLVAGIVTQYPITHEFGHYTGALIVGKHSRIEYSPNGNIYYKDTFTTQENKIISSSGFILPLMISEAVLDLEVSKGNPYVMGLILGPLIHNLSYIVQDLSSTRTDQYNDLEHMDQDGIGREITYPIMIIIPMIQVYRLYRNEEAKSRWGLWMNYNGEKNGASLVVGYTF